MSNYRRVTRECLPAQLRPELRQAIRNHVEQHGLGNIEDLLMCCETVSEKKEAGWLSALLSGGTDRQYATALVVTPQWLIWARHGETTGTTVSAAKLKDIEVRSITAPLTRDAGLEVSGYVEGFPSRLRGYIALGPEPAARQFCETAAQAVSKAHPPTARTLFGVPWPRR